MKFIGFLIIVCMLGFLIYQNNENKKQIEILNNKIILLEKSNSTPNSKKIKASCQKAKEYIKTNKKEKALKEINNIEALCKDNSNEDDLIDTIKDNIDKAIKEKVLDYIK